MEGYISEDDWVRASLARHQTHVAIILLMAIQLEVWDRKFTHLAQHQALRTLTLLVRRELEPLHRLVAVLTGHRQLPAVLLVLGQIRLPESFPAGRAGLREVRAIPGMVRHVDPHKDLRAHAASHWPFWTFLTVSVRLPSRDEHAAFLTIDVIDSTSKSVSIDVFLCRHRSQTYLTSDNAATAQIVLMLAKFEPCVFPSTELASAA